LPDTVVALKGVSLAYQKAWSRSLTVSLDNLDLEINRGETVGFIGNNGAGKSTTMRLILGLQKPTKGSVQLNGISANESRARIGVAYVPESPYLYDYLTPLELLQIGAGMHGLAVAASKKELENHCMAWLERFSIAHVARKRIKTYSKGMTQRTALAHALACKPNFLILDEPLSGLDPIGRQEVVAILDEYRAEGNTLFFSSHVLNDVERLADRFVFIEKGKVQAVCSTPEVFSGPGARFVVTLEGLLGLEGFEKISSRLWQKEVDEGELAMLIDDAIRDRGGSGMAIYSIKNINNLERAYYSFVRNSVGEKACET
jgi:ABC-2 type transport system ATP-binding protein